MSERVYCQHALAVKVSKYSEQCACVGRVQRRITREWLELEGRAWAHWKAELKTHLMVSLLMSFVGWFGRNKFFALAARPTE